MKTIYFLISFVCATALLSCFPKNMKEEMTKALQESQVVIADQQFKSVLNNIEMFKLRNGYYPDSLGEITFVSDFDKSDFKAVEYINHFDRYELNLKAIPKNMEPYPLEFWNGLGCTRSNLMPRPWLERDSAGAAGSY